LQICFAAAKVGIFSQTAKFSGRKSYVCAVIEGVVA